MKIPPVLFIAAGLLLGSFTSTVARAEKLEMIPAEKFFSNAAIASVQISPDGTHVAFRMPMKDRIGIALMDLATGKVEPLVRAADENIKSFFWKGNDYLVFIADVGGNEAAAFQSINIRNGHITRLIESFGENNYTRQWGQWGGVVSEWITNPRKIIIQGSKEEASRQGGYYEVDITNGKRWEVGGFPQEKSTIDLFFDNAGKIRLQAIDTEKEVLMQARLGAETRFTPLMTFPRDSELSSMEHRVFLSVNQTLLFVDYKKHDRGAMVAWDLLTGREKDVLFVPPEGEITGLITGRDAAALLGVYYEADKTHVAWFDRDFATIQAGLDRALPETFNAMTNWSDDRKKIVVASTSDREARVYMIFDRTGAQPKIIPLGSAQPDLDSKSLARMEAVRFKARDGLELQGYLTKPVGVAGPWSLIIHPHGGPYGIRDSWGYDPEVQFLASRGYAVLQVNYRGSGGFGRKFLEAGRLEWGKKMQDDLTDAVQWAVSQGITTSDRVGIFGASYGGYAALAGAAFTPDLYRCAINYVGAVDLTYLGRRDQGGNRISNEFFYEKWVHPDMQELARRSPVNYVENIKIPTLHAYGENDPRVEWRQWKKLKSELDKHHQTYEVFNQEDEGHGFANAPARVRFYLKLEEFLAKNMKAKN